MSSADPLAGLHDIHLPEAIGWWPLAPGWWWLFGGLVAIITLAVWLYRRRPHPARAVALLTLDEAMLHWRKEADDAALASAVSALLRRYARVIWRPEDVSALTGDDWADFLEHHSPGPWRAMIARGYGAAVALDGMALSRAARAWIRAQHPRRNSAPKPWPEEAA